ncbi:hypothetical protein ACB098_07G163700 [Castanea mollissima]|uniref:Hexosyltransferase n=1 Tax=Castanea mollissima TaxID=60419 RepID=A0A8J4QER1_9ROSI|nr:hypothetical protein CMV_025314 [Castanea mollissima]
MEAGEKPFPSFHFLQILIFISLMLCNLAFVKANVSNPSPFRREFNEFRPLYYCERCLAGKVQDTASATGVNNYPDEQDIDIIATYSDTSGAIRISRVKMRDLSASWVWENPMDVHHDQSTSSETVVDSFQSGIRSGENAEHYSDGHQDDRIPYRYNSSMSPVKRMRQIARKERRDLRTAQLIQQDKETDNQMAQAAIERSKSLDTTVKRKYNIWRQDFVHPHSDSILKLMQDQMIMAKAYASIAKSKNESELYSALMAHSNASQIAIGEAHSDAELHPSALDQAKAMGHILSRAKDKLYDCDIVARTFRAMVQSTEDKVTAMRKKTAFLIQLAAKTIPKRLQCLPLQLAADYYIQVTDKLNFAAMRMWFLVNPPMKATIQVENIDDFKWLNSSYCSVLRQLESARTKEYYFKVNHPTTVSAGEDNLKYRNPKYLSMLNHLRFYLPEVYPKLDKILFLDDDIVVQKDLTPLWSVDLQGMVNGAVETCKESFHRFDKYLNFSNPKISENFDPNACGWAFGMNIFDLKEWKKRNITGIYHRWQDMNEDRTLWKLGSLPPGLITFYNLTYPLDRGWHVLGLGYDPALNQSEIENAAVIHYNGNYKPWLDLAVSKYNSYWSRYVMFDNHYLQFCDIRQ